MSAIPASLAMVSPDLATGSDLGRGPRAAREFEACLIGSLLESLEKSFASLPGENSLAGGDDYNYLGTRALSEALAARGGFGIAAMISHDLAAHESKGAQVIGESPNASPGG